MSRPTSPKDSRKSSRPAPRPIEHNAGIPGSVEFDPRVSPPGTVSTSDFPSAEFVVAQTNRRWAATTKSGKQKLVTATSSFTLDSADLNRLGDFNTASSNKQSYSLSDNMSKAVTFSGKPSQLEPCLTYCHVHLLANNVQSETARAGFLASLLRGPALNWLTQQLKTNTALLEDYSELQEQLKKAFALDDDARKLQAARQLSGLHQKGSVRDYALKFEQLADEAGLNDATKIALFTKGLKSKIRESLIINDESGSFDSAKAEATRIDSQFYYAQRHYQTRNDGKQRRGKDGRFKSTPVKHETTW